jgi:uncharacterized protein (DUF2252 family)
MKVQIETRDQRYERGKALRKERTRESLAVHKRRSSASIVLDLLHESNKDRLQALVPVRYGRMAQSPFHFYRGTALLQARDLMAGKSSGVVVQCCGDCHIMNFGGFATPERSLSFDINDFDETFPAPFEWDLKRLTASIVVAGRYLGFADEDSTSAVHASVESYREHMQAASERTVLQNWYDRITLDMLLEIFGNDKDARSRLKRKQAEAQTRTSESVFPKLTQVVDGLPRIIDEPPLIYHFQHQIKDLDKQRTRLLEEYRASLVSDRRALFDRYQIIDSALKVVGVGSVGTRCMISLFLADVDDPLFLQIKEARRSVLERPKGKSAYAHQGERIVSGQRLMQAATDIFIGWTSTPNGRNYFVRQLRDQKVTAEPETFKKRTLEMYATLCGWALARAHAKAGDPSLIAGYVGNSSALDEALAVYAVAYADQVERDFTAFKRAIATGKLHTDADEKKALEFSL